MTRIQSGQKSPMKTRSTSQSVGKSRPSTQSPGINNNEGNRNGKTDKSQSLPAPTGVSAKVKIPPAHTISPDIPQGTGLPPNPQNLQVITGPIPKQLTRLLTTPQRTTMVKSTVGFDRSRSLRIQVERAIREHKIYSCVGVYPAVRKALQKRGWIEKNSSLGISKSTNLSNTSKELDPRGIDDESDQAWMNRVLKDYPPDFWWVIRRDNIEWRSLHKDQIINRYPKAFFTTKVGIAACLQNIHWFSESGISDTFFPRCYRLCIDEEKLAFVDDYRLSACMGLLKWVVTAFEKDGEDGVMDQSSRVVSLAVDFAIRQVNNYVRMRRHEDIDWLMPPGFMGQHWDSFLNSYYNVVHLKGKLAPNDSQDTGKIKYEASKRALARLGPYWPQLNIDGSSNIWICKPGARSRGKGIVIMNELDKILDLCTQNNFRELNWVVQKYIERPMLVYKTKFDIRQWFIVSDWAPLTVWFYKESYIRFCTKPFNMEDFHESIHLCNNAVQCRYQNSNQRDSALPDENMWDNYTFQAYLKTQGKMDYWDSLIYPAMKQGILGVLLASQETVDVRKNCFELYGADFMLSEDMRPWLIEINSCPCMAPSTSVTARMCAQCLEDTIKVIVDRKEDRNADTGMFELMYKQDKVVPLQPFNGVELIIQGKKLTKDIDFNTIMSKYNSKRGSQSGSSSSRSLRSAHQSSISNGLTFMDLVQRLRLKDAQSTSLESTDSSLNSGSSGQILSRALTLTPDKDKEDEVDTAAQNIVTTHTNIHKIEDNSTSSGQDVTSDEGQMTKSMSPSKTPPQNQSPRRVRLVTEDPSSGQGQTQHHVSNTKTSLSVLLKSSPTNEPTMADLVRLTQELAAEAKSRAKNANDQLSPPTPRPGDVKPTKSVTSSGTWSGPFPGQSNWVMGKIRPNARINSNPPKPPVGKEGGAPHLKELKEDSNSTNYGYKYGKGKFSSERLNDLYNNYCRQSLKSKLNVNLISSKKTKTKEGNSNVDVILYVDNFSPTTSPESNLNYKSEKRHGQHEHSRATHDGLTCPQSQTLSPSKSPVTSTLTSTSNSSLSRSQREPMKFKKCLPCSKTRQKTKFKKSATSPTKSPLKSCSKLSTSVMKPENDGQKLIAQSQSEHLITPRGKIQNDMNPSHPDLHDIDTEHEELNGKDNNNNDLNVDLIKDKLLNPFFPLNLTTHDSIDDDENGGEIEGDQLAKFIEMGPPQIFRRFKVPRSCRKSRSHGGGSTPKNLVSSFSSNRRRLLQYQNHPHPCYRITLDHPRTQAALYNSKKYMAALPLKTVNLYLT